MKNKWMILPVALLAVVGLLMTGCGGGDKDGDKDNGKPSGGSDITWTVAADTGETTPSITFTFSKAVAGLTADNITLTAGTGSATKGTLSAVAGQGNKKYTLTITEVSAGAVGVKITKSGVSSSSKNVTLTKAADITYDYYFVDGKWKAMFADIDDTLELEAEKEYVISLNITAIDSELVGSHFGGQVYATNDDSEVNDGKAFLLAGWQNSSPDTVAAGEKTYKWTFIVGQKYADQATPFNLDDIPETSELYVEITSQGKGDDWSSGHPGSFGFDGTITIEEKVVLNMEHVGDVVSVAGFPQSGGSNIEGTEFQKLVTAKAGSELIISVTAAHIYASAPDEPRAGWGVGKFGTDGPGITIPGDVETGEDIGFEVTVSVDEILAEAGENNYIYANIYSGCSITKMELWSPVD